MHLMSSYMVILEITTIGRETVLHLSLTFEQDNKYSINEVNLLI